ncbi:MAG: hypothetical protein Q9166_001935 [cf. Caloplaca sp. 2 TL-2023]
MANILLILSFLAAVVSLAGALPATISERDTISLQNFQFPADTALVNNLVSAFTDALVLANTVIGTSAWNTPTFNLYFPPEARKNVSSIFHKIHDGASSQVVFDNKDMPFANDAQHRDFCVASPSAAYTINPVPPKIHLCPNFWKVPSLRNIAGKVCEGSQMSRDMVYQGSVMLHEFTHVDVFHPGYHVRDIKYGPASTRDLRKTTPSDAEFNADNFMWFALCA